MEPTDVGYIAGFIDGEGCLHIGRYLRKQRNPRYELSARLHISNTDRGVLEWIREITGVGNIREEKRVPGWSRTFRLQIGNLQKLKELIPSYLAYLKVKKRHAELFLEFVRSRLGQRRREGYSGREWQIYHELKVLNQKGLGPREQLGPGTRQPSGLKSECNSHLERLPRPGPSTGEQHG